MCKLKAGHVYIHCTYCLVSWLFPSTYTWALIFSGIHRSCHTNRTDHVQTIKRKLRTSCQKHYSAHFLHNHGPLWLIQVKIQPKSIDPDTTGMSNFPNSRCITDLVKYLLSYISSGPVRTQKKLGLPT
jgi:hypothetical protein